MLLLLSAIPTAMRAYVLNEFVQYGDQWYQVIDLSNFKVSFVGVKDNVSGTLEIPSTWNDGKGTTFTVTAVGGSELYKCTNITKIIMPEGIESIKWASFGGAKLQELNLPSTVKEINNIAFYNISELPKVTVDPANPYFVADADGALYSYDKTRLYTVPTAIDPAGGVYHVDPAVEEIGNGAFLKAPNVTKIVLPKNLKKVVMTYPVFYENCYNLVEFDVASGGTTDFYVIDGVLFKGTTLVAYPRAKNVMEYTVPVGITEIGERAIEGNRFMKDIDLNDVERLNKASIISNENLLSITLPKNLSKENILGAIANNLKINEYKAPADCVNFEVIDGVVYSKGDSHATLYFFPPAKTVDEGKYTILDGVKTIADRAFYGNKYIKEVNIPTSVEKLSEMAFRNSVLLEKVCFEEPSMVTEIGNNAFGWCKRLTTVTLPSSLKELRISFAYCENLETINVPDGSQLEYIGGEAFTTNKALKNFNFEGSCELKTIASRAFAGTALVGFEFPKGVTDIRSSAFSNCKNMTTVKFADDAILTTIGSGAFADCGLTSIDIPESVTKIDREAFRNCAALTEVNVSENLINISSEAFKYCKNLFDINVDKKNPVYSSIDGYLLSKDKKTLVLFPHGKSHEKFTLLPPSITKIGDYAFYECENLTSVMIPNKVTSIGDRAFSLCNNLRDIALLCDEPIDPANIDQRVNHKSFDDGTAGTTNMPANITIYVRKDVKAQYDAIPFYKDNFKSIQPSFEENGNEYLQVGSNVADLLSVKSENHTFVVPEKTQSGLEVALIGDYAFQTASNKIKEVVVKNHIEYVGAKAFMTDIANNSSTIENVFFISGAPSKRMLSTTRFELDETGTNYKEFASTTNIYVKKSVVEDYKTSWKKEVFNIASGAMEDSPADYQFYMQIDYKIKGTPALTDKLYSTFSREFDVDFGDIDETGNRLFWNTNENCPEVIAFTSGQEMSNSTIRMQSINLGDDISKDGLYVPANTGVVLKAVSGSLPSDFYYRIGEDDVWTYSGANIVKPVTENAKDIVETEDGNPNFYISAGKAFRVSESQQFKRDGKLTLGVHKAYINISVPAGVRPSLLFKYGETTGIESLHSTDGAASAIDDAYYNLNGQRVTKPFKGTYIHNGKKLIVK